jgi:hypothetical protein
VLTGVHAAGIRKAVISTMIDGAAKAATVNNVQAGNSFPAFLEHP